MRYRKKPIEVQATPVEFVLAASKLDDTVLPDWILDAIHDRVLKVLPEMVTVRTLEGVMTGSVNDYLIQGVNGELYPCRGDIFLKTYELVAQT